MVPSCLSKVHGIIYLRALKAMRVIFGIMHIVFASNLCYDIVPFFVTISHAVNAVYMGHIR